MREDIPGALQGDIPAAPQEDIPAGLSAEHLGRGWGWMDTADLLLEAPPQEADTRGRCRSQGQDTLHAVQLAGTDLRPAQHQGQPPTRCTVQAACWHRSRIRAEAEQELRRLHRPTVAVGEARPHTGADRKAAVQLRMAEEEHRMAVAVGVGLGQPPTEV